jgi:thymidylate synthase
MNKNNNSIFINTSPININKEEEQYLNLIKNILNVDNFESSRNGNTKSIFGYSMRFSLKDGSLPLLTTKKVAWKTCFQELMWFINGSTNNKDLNDKGVHIWDANASRDFLDSRGLTYNAINDLGPVYGHQWRHFNAEYKDCNSDYKGEGIDQLQNIINQLKTEEGRTSRRLIMTAWNPCQIDEMALPPCHILVQFNVREQKYLSCSLYQRSGDVGLGVPFNIASYSFLTHILAKHCHLIPEDFVYFLGNSHIYENHIPILEEQILRTPYPFPKIIIQNKHENIEDYSIDDIQWENPYIHYNALKMDMIA